MSHLSSIIDLHCHSTASDGTLSPSELVEQAANNGVKYLALTDHDSISGIEEASLSGELLGVNIIPGVEFSAQWKNQGIHILGLNFDPSADVIHEAVERQEKSRYLRAKTICERLEKKGFEGLYESALVFSAGQAPGRPHIASAMVEKDYVVNSSAAFKKYLGAGKLGDIKNVWPHLDEVVRWITEAGGIAVIAHPRKYNMTVTKLRSLIADFKSCGGEGLEVITSGQKQGEIGLLADLCTKFELKGSIGSDFHSLSQSWVKLGAIPSLPKSVTPVWSDWTLTT